MIVDVGANTGVYSLLAKAVNPRAKVYAFEPIQRIYSILEQNIVLNRGRWPDTPEIQAHRIALSDYNGSGTMFDLPVEHMYTASLNKNIHLERGNPVHAVTESVKVQRLDNFCNTFGIIPDLIKIDVESHEPAVLRGFGDLLVRHQPTIICEIWDNKVGAAVEVMVASCAYRYVAIGQMLEEKPHITNDEPGSGYINYLLAPELTLASLSINCRPS